MTIYKYTIPSNQFDYIIAIPKKHLFLDCQEQNGLIALWFEVDPESIKEKHRFRIYFIGHDVKAGDRYLATCLIGEFVWHVYECEPVLDKSGAPIQSP